MNNTSSSIIVSPNPEVLEEQFTTLFLQTLGTPLVSQAIISALEEQNLLPEKAANKTIHSIYAIDHDGKLCLNSLENCFWVNLRFSDYTSIHLRIDNGNLISCTAGERAISPLSAFYAVAA